MANSKWTTKNYKEFKPGDIICNAKNQSFLRLVIKVDKNGFWCVGLVNAALTENKDHHPVFYMSFKEIEYGAWNEMTRLGNLDDYKEYIKRVKDECVQKE